MPALKKDLKFGFPTLGYHRKFPMKKTNDAPAFTKRLGKMRK